MIEIEMLFETTNYIARGQSHSKSFFIAAVLSVGSKEGGHSFKIVLWSQL